jgi:hypothetical protein
MQEAIEVAKENMAKAQAKMERDINAYHRPIDFDVGGEVYISTKRWVTQRPSRKFDHQMAGSFPITRRVGNLYEVQLPESLKIHNVFSPDRLRKDTDNPLPGQTNDPPLPIVVTTD